MTTDKIDDYIKKEESLVEGFKRIKEVSQRGPGNPQQPDRLADYKPKQRPPAGHSEDAYPEPTNSW